MHMDIISNRSILKCLPISFLLELIRDPITFDSQINVHRILEFLNMDEEGGCALDAMDA